MPRLLFLMLAILVIAAGAAIKISSGEEEEEKVCGKGYACVTPQPLPEEVLARMDRAERISELMSVPSGRIITEGATIVRTRPEWLPESLTRAVVARRNASNPN